MRFGWVARASWGAVAIALSACWLADFGDLSSAYDAGSGGGMPPGVDSGEGGNGADAGPGSDAAQGFCPAVAAPNTYCMDFDGVDAATLPLEVNGATAGIVNGPDVSPPSSLSVRVSGSNAYGRYEVDFPFQPTQTTLEFELQTPGLAGGVTTVGISLEDAADTVRSLNIVVSQNGGFQVQEFFAFADGGSEINPHLNIKLDDAGAPATWHHAVLTLAVDVPSMTYFSTLIVDGQTIEGRNPLGLAWVPGTVGLHIGATYSKMGTSQFYFDNVRASFTM